MKDFSCTYYLVGCFELFLIQRKKNQDVEGGGVALTISISISISRLYCATPVLFSTKQFHANRPILIGKCLV